MAIVKIYGTRHCGYCLRAEAYLMKKGVTHIDKALVDIEPRLRQEMLERTGRRTVPQIFIDEVHIGGYSDLVRLDQGGWLDSLLEG